MSRYRNYLTYTFMLAVAAVLGTAAARAATISTGNADIFPTTARVIASSATTPNTTAEVTSGSAADQSLAQTFQVSSAFNLNSIFIRYRVSAGPLSVNLSLYPVADVEAGQSNPPVGTNLIALADQVLSFPANTSDNRFAKIELDTQVPLAATTGTAGYVLRFSGDAATFPGFGWDRSGATAANTYAGGAAFESGLSKGTGAAARDYVMALVPEPSSLVLVGLAACLAPLGRRRRT